MDIYLFQCAGRQHCERSTVETVAESVENTERSTPIWKESMMAVMLYLRCHMSHVTCHVS